MIRSLLLFIAVFGVDQSVKSFARTHPLLWQGAFFRLTENPNIAFSIPLPLFALWTLLLLAVGAVVVMSIRLFLQGRTRSVAWLALVIGGGASNILDRLRFGAVTDVFALPGGLLFNIADGAIIVGIIFFLVWHKKFSPHLS